MQDDGIEQEDIPGSFVLDGENSYYIDWDGKRQPLEIDFSEELTTLSDLRKDNERLRKQLSYWRNEVKTTDKPTVRRDDVEKLSRRLIRKYHSTLIADELK